MTATITFIAGIVTGLLAVWALREHRKQREARRYAAFMLAEDERQEIAARIRRQEVMRAALRGTGHIAFVRGGDA